MDSDPRLVVVLDGRFVADDYPGIGRYIFNLCHALPALAPSCRIHLLVDRHARQTRYDLDALSSRGVEIVADDFGVRSFRGQFALGRVCRRLSADVCHTPHLLSAGALPCPSVVTIHDVIPLHAAGRLPTRRAQLIYRLLLHRALRHAAGVLTPSEAAAADLRSHCAVRGDRLWVTPYASDDRFKPASPKAVAAMRGRLGLPERYVLCVGTQKPHKNLEMLVQAWRAVAGRDAGAACLALAGGSAAGPRTVQPRDTADATSDRVRWVGDVSEGDLPALYTGARFVVQPSLLEGFGLPVLEAMACGAPVLCAQTPALTEVTGGAALLFDPTSVSACSAALRRALEDDALRADLTARGFVRVREFSWSRTASLTLDAYVGAVSAQGQA